MNPGGVLRQVALRLEREGASSYRVRAFRRAAAVIERLSREELERRAAEGTLTELSGIGQTTAGVVVDALAGREPAYLTEIVGSAGNLPEGGELLAALRGDCHTHSDWSDGGGSVDEMAEAARVLGHEYLVLTDHSPRLAVARGLSADRLRRQLDVVAELNAAYASEGTPFRVLTGIEVDILDDGSLDQEPELLAELDLVVASVHSHLRMDSRRMTGRMVAAVSNPNVDVLGHCTGRLVTGRGRPASEFDADAVFEACREHDVAVEINSRPERLDPPRRLLSRARELGCRFAVDTDAHAPGQLGWQPYGCARALDCGVAVGDVVNTLPAARLLEWTRR